MIAYASRTGTKRNNAALKAAGWGILVSPPGELRDEGFERVAIDNGAYSAWTRGVEWDPDPFRRALALFGGKADWASVPDIVGGGLESLGRSLTWIPEVLAATQRVLIPVQNGMEPGDLRPHIGERVGIFVGGAPELDGSTEWKERTMGIWGKLCADMGAWCHVGRVNSYRRIRLCHLAKAHSFDGTSATRYSKNLPKLDRCRRSPTFPWGEM